MKSQQPGQMHPEDYKNLIIFMIAAVIIWLAFDHYILQPRMDAMKAAQQERSGGDTPATGPGADTAVTAEPRPREEIIRAADAKRVKIDNGAVFGSLSLKGNRLDDLKLTNYYRTLDKQDHITLLSPAGSFHPEFAEIGWLASSENVALPDKNTQWRLAEGSADTLKQGQPVTLEWGNGQGLTFSRTYKIDEHFLITVDKKVENTGDKTVTLYPYSLVARHGLPRKQQATFILHEGPLGYIDGELHEWDYGELRDQARPAAFESRTGWIGITEKYWLTSLLPAQDENTKYRFIHKAPDNPAGRHIYQVDAMGAARTIAPGETAESRLNIFSGAKQVKLLAGYEEELGVTHFDLAVDFGWLYFLTRPFHFLLTTFFEWTGNFGVAIIILTILLRLAVFPLANKSYKSFANLRKVSPQMMELREKYGDDKQKLQQELVKLYEKEKVNPMAGCLPILVQIPIFFALYKVIFITIEMRHEPFFGWIQDLTAPDPTSIFNLFGLLPFGVPDFMQIGIWPCLMLLFILAQQRLNPPPQDPTQKMIMRIFPFMITIILARFPSGLVIYWTCSNFLSVIQQYIIMRSMGVEVDILRRSKDDQKMEEMVEEGPDVHPELEYVEEEVEEAMFGDEEGEAGQKEGKKEGRKDGPGGDREKISPPRPKKKKKKK